MILERVLRIRLIRSSVPRALPVRGTSDLAVSDGQNDGGGSG
jgi:hypothetical protein